MALSKISFNRSLHKIMFYKNGPFTKSHSLKMYIHKNFIRNDLNFKSLKIPQKRIPFSKQSQNFLLYHSNRLQRKLNGYPFEWKSTKNVPFI